MQMSRSIAVTAGRFRRSIVASRTQRALSTDTGFFTKTPLIKADNVNSGDGEVELFFKMENLQPSGSFKDRGISHMIKTLSDRGTVSRLICSSGGNAGHSVATIGAKIGLPVEVFVPVTTLPMMIEKLRKRSAIVHVGGENWNKADEFARKALTFDLNAKYIPPYDDPLIWEGHATIIDEISKQLKDIGEYKPDAIVLSVGGGGLLAGVQKGLDRKGWKDVKVIAAETQGAASFAAAKSAGQVVKLEKINTIASSLGALSVTPAVIDPQSPAARNTKSLVVTDHEALSACIQFANEQRTLVEPACGAAIAAVYSKRCLKQVLNIAAKPSAHEKKAVHEKRAARVVVIVCGGSIVSLDLIHQWKQKLDGN